jgi:uncharacterized membrane protein YfcA
MEFITTNLSWIIFWILAALGVATVVYMGLDFFKFKKEHGLEKDASWIKSGCIGFITNFLDVLGIGSFATTTAGLRLFKQTDDKKLPGILNIGCTVPVLVDALLFINKIEVEPLTLATMLVSSAIGAYIGAGIVAKLDRQYIRITMGVALVIAAFLMFAGLPWIQILPSGGTAIGLTGGKLVFAIIANFVLGALMTAGIGLYGPCMALVYLLGLSPIVAFPIMMGSCALLMPVASFRFIRENAYGRKSAMAIQLAGIVGVIIAVRFVVSLPMDMLRVVVIIALLYTSFTLLYSFAKDLKKKKA